MVSEVRQSVVREARQLRSKRLRVLLYSDSNSVGGAELAAAALVGHSVGQVDFLVVGVEERVVAAIANRGAVEQVQLSPVEDKRDLNGVRAHLRAFRDLGESVDLVQLNMRSPWSCQYGLLASVLVGLPIVAVHHAVVEPVAITQVLPIRLLARRVWRCVGVSCWVASSVERLWRLPPARIEVIPNGAALRSGGGSEGTRERNKVPAVLGGVGRLSREKGFDVLIRAMAELPQAVLELAGDGPCRAELEALARRLGLAERVRFLGWHPCPAEVMSAWDVVVVPSRREGFGLVALEAMLAGVPVVASRVGGLPELVRDRQTGLLFDPENPSELADAVREVLSDPLEAQARCQAALKMAARDYSPDAMVAAYMGLYDQAPIPARRKRQ